MLKKVTQIIGARFINLAEMDLSEIDLRELGKKTRAKILAMTKHLCAKDGVDRPRLFCFYPKV